MTKVMINIILIYLGTISGVFLSLYVFKLAQYGELLVPEFAVYIFLSLVALVQVSVFVLAVYAIGKKLDINFLMFPLNNFLICFLFSVIYLVLTIVVTPEIRFLSISTAWFNLIVLPVLVFLPLACIDYFILFRN